MQRFKNCGGSSPKMQDLLNLYEIGTERLYNELNLVSIIKNLRNLEFIIKNNLTDDLIKLQTIFDKNNVIDLDDLSGNELSSSDGSVDLN